MCQMGDRAIFIDFDYDTLEDIDVPVIIIEDRGEWCLVREDADPGAGDWLARKDELK